jgi:ABC-type dipeptide/oligopeptide/nickel transport system ATPase subunit
MFPDVGIVREVQQELDTVIEEGVINIVNLLKNQVSLPYCRIDKEFATFI